MKELKITFFIAYFGFSPGAAEIDSSLRLSTWFMDNTVAATNHGIPKNELTPIHNAIINKSKW